jgi:hypothetical protein
MPGDAPVTLDAERLPGPGQTRQTRGQVMGSMRGLGTDKLFLSFLHVGTRHGNLRSQLHKESERGHVVGPLQAWRGFNKRPRLLYDGRTRAIGCRKI